MHKYLRRHLEQQQLLAAVNVKPKETETTQAASNVRSARQVPHGSTSSMTSNSEPDASSEADSPGQFRHPISFT